MKRLIYLMLIPLFLGSQQEDRRVPWVQVTTVSATTVNSFPVPPDRSVCLVFRAIAQSQGIDYDMIDGGIVFKNPPVLVAGVNPDVIQIVCF